MTDEMDIYDELPFSAGEGWAEMKLLLDKNLAVRKRDTAIRLLFSSLPAILFFAVFMLSFLQLDMDVLPLQHHTTGLQAEPATILAAVPAGKNYTAIKTGGSGAVTPRNSHVAVNENDLETGNGYIAATVKQTAQKISIENIGRDIPVNKTRRSVIKAISINNQTDFPMTIIPGKKEKLLKPWEFAAGIGVNMAAGKIQNLQPYPVAEIRYNLNRHVFVATGISLFSPAPGNVSGISKTVYVNDTANNICLYNEQVGHSHLRYADVPVFAGVNISPEFSLQAGLQASFLLSSKQEKKLQPYDFGMNSVEASLNPLVGFAANPHEEFNVRLRNTDYRFITGIQYRQDKITAGLFYQQGLQPSGTGSHTSKNSNRLFTLSLLYRFSK